MNKNSTLTIKWEPKDYPSTSIIITCDEDSTADEMLQYFARFLAAAGYSPSDITELLNI